MQTSVKITAFVVLGMALWGCKDDEIRVYQSPKEQPILAQDQPSATIDPPPAERIRWTVPKDWRRLPGKQPMRVATFETGNADQRLEISVTAFPGNTGGLLANVNRWRDQLGLQPIDQSQLVDHVSPLSHNTFKGSVVEISGASTPVDGATNRLTAVIMDDGMGMTWFVKAAAPAATMARHRDALLRFAHSFTLSDQPAGVDDHQPDARPGPDEAAVSWDRPEHWQPDTEASMIATAAFRIDTQADGFVKVTVTALPGDGGGMLDNLNRWRQQVGLPKIDALADQPKSQLSAGPVSATLFDLLAPTGATARHQHILVAVLTEPDRTWFVKMTGPHAGVQEQKAAFDRFVRSIRFGLAGRS